MAAAVIGLAYIVVYYMAGEHPVHEQPRQLELRRRLRLPGRRLGMAVRWR